jgi:energy-coupling factor transport system substrate-specific component
MNGLRGGQSARGKGVTLAQLISSTSGPGEKITRRTRLLKKFTVRDIVFLAILAATLTIVGALTMPLAMTVSLFGVRNAAAAAFYGLFGAIGLMKVRKPGALVLIGIFNGVILLMMAPVMFFNNLFGSLLAEIIALLIFRGYQRDVAASFAAGLFIPLTLPLSLLFGMLLNGQTLAQLITEPRVSLFICAAAVLLSFLGSFIGWKISSELRKAGKL